MTITTIIDSMLEARGMSRRQLAIAADIPPSSLQSALARGGDMPISMLKKIAAALEVPTGKLLGLDSTEVTISDEQLKKFQMDFENALTTVILLPDDEKQTFYNLIDATNIVLNYARSVGVADNLMGQPIAIDRFLSASMDVTTICSQLSKRAYEKYWALNPGKRPRINVSAYTKAPEQTGGETQQ